MARRRRETNRDGGAVWLLIGGLFVLFLLAANGAQQEAGVGDAKQEAGAGETKPKEPQFYFDLGLMKFAVTYKENKLNDKLKLSKSSMSYFLADQGNPFHKHLLKATLREDLVRCDNFLADRPEMESLIDCKPLDSHVLSKVPAEQATQQQQQPMSTKYVKRTALGYKSKIEKLPWLSFLNMVPKQDFHFYPFEPDYTQQSVRRILKDNGMPNQDLGFGPYSVTTGDLLVANLSERVRCTVNLFISVNLTEPIPEKDPLDDFPEAFHVRGHLLTKFRENGGFVSLQDASCGPPGASGFSLDSDFTFIYRKQFPYVTCSHTIASKPVSVIWSYNGTIKQIKDPQSTEAYNTSVQIESLSGLATAFNFKLDQNFTNKDFATGSEHMLLVHPVVTAFVQGDWTQDSLVKSLLLFFKQDLQPTLLKDGPGFLKDPKLMFSYSDKPEEKHVTLTMTVARDLFKDLQSSLDEMIEGSMYEAAPPRRDELTAEQMKALEQIVNLGVNMLVRDEL